MSSFIFFVFVWPVVGAVLLCAFGLYLARQDRIAYERHQAEALPPHIQEAARVANEKFIADALKEMAERPAA
jgi:hypothetical protein